MKDQRKIKQAEVMICEILSDLIADVPVTDISVFLEKTSKYEPNSPIEKLRVSIYTQRKV